MKKNINMRLKIFGVIAILFIIVNIVITFAYIRGNSENIESVSTIALEGAILKVVYSGNSENIVVNDILPGFEANKSFTITSDFGAGNENNHVDLWYQVMLIVEENDFNDNYIKYSLTVDEASDNDGTVLPSVSNVGIPNGSSLDGIIIGSGKFYSHNKTHIYNLNISYPENGEDQTDQIGNKFAAYVVLSRANFINVTFDLDGGKFTDYKLDKNSRKKVAEFSLLKTSSPVKEGYKYKGWRLMTDNNANIDGDNIAVQNTDVTVQAQWVPLIKFTIDVNGGTTTQELVSSVEINSIVSLIEPTRTGYTFQGWEIISGTADINQNTIIVSTTDVTVRAKWNINKYTVAFNSDGGSNVPSQTVEYGSTATAPTNPTKDGYMFDGWTLNGSAFNFSTKITSNITLVANWKSVIPIFTYLKSDGTEASYLLINDTANDWRIKFFESGTLKFSYLGNATSGIDVFLVGGGGAGGASTYVNAENPLWGGGGGGGGYTATKNVPVVNIGTNYSIVVGAGGTMVSGGSGNKGGETSAFGYSVNGGYGGYVGASVANGRKGGNGGSGGGSGGKYSSDTGVNSASTAGGSDGANGGGSSGGTGQGTTTREFGSSTGTLYAGGGGGARSSAGSNSAGGAGGGSAGNDGNAAANLGGGGGGGRTPGNGGSGVVIIRNRR